MTAPSERPFADAVVVAAGSSSRMGGIDKLDAIVGGLPLLAYPLAAIAAAPEVRRIILVTSAERAERVAGASWRPAKLELLVTGGEQRQDSVRQGYEHAVLDPWSAAEPGDLPEAEVILVHDGARPLVPTELVSAVARAARKHGAAIPIVPVGDTIKRVADDGTVVGAGERSALGAAQTPQGIQAAVLRAAYQQAPSSDALPFTDEAALLEACRIAVHAIPGDERNFKVTVPADLARVEQALGRAGSDGAPRIGFGSDSHPFGPELGLALGGVTIPAAPRLHGHSDGDVLLHAIADALLGAAALGDLGRLFPAGPATPRGIASSDLIATVVRRVADAGLAVASLDCTIVAARPPLAALLATMEARIAELIDADPAAVNVKASTGNLDGMEGAGRGISATAVVVLRAGSAGR